jgi:hypothetical protein
MSNLEENYEGANNGLVNDPDEKQSGTTGQTEADSADENGKAGSTGIDPEHNTGNERMRIDEEGAEIGPDDEV